MERIKNIFNVRILIAWLINTAALLAVTHLMDSVKVDDLLTAVISAALLAFINTLIRPVLLVLTFPITLMTMGIFIFFINGLMFWTVSKLVDGFHVAGFWSAVGGALLYSIISFLLNAILLGRTKVHFEKISNE